VRWSVTWAGFVDFNTSRFRRPHGYMTNLGLLFCGRDLFWFLGLSLCLRHRMLYTYHSETSTKSVSARCPFQSIFAFITATTLHMLQLYHASTNPMMILLRARWWNWLNPVDFCVSHFCSARAQTTQVFRSEHSSCTLLPKFQYGYGSLPR
jgi:hypothetical protein